MSLIWMGVDIAKAQAMWATARGVLACAIRACSLRSADPSSVEIPISRSRLALPHGGLDADGVGVSLPLDM